MSAQFTPGPWAVERCDATPCFHIEAGAYPFGTNIGEVNEAHVDREANARLIAAAPELFSALEALVMSADDLDRISLDFEPAITALRKARGEASTAIDGMGGR